ncbi:uncharacterized protein PHACADRAFT_259097 [Phanerochaete carnosa HHB-10118-sp]|uniref:Uncharacterized protein n=1 Tax=Phanerochaete carnosa (strain HHB-10118-sp) TaxID=650164 RepID=K5W1F1_PHACS|nr:uncharacterized protein PHACADRAFT_259097 [Phanerochaete carnosa HHB-10118-sp]EKM52930.1 hypothetical protein PHACADRAFT_259097 [Phanerochaete carnosa HHB-10118-sp]
MIERMFNRTTASTSRAARCQNVPRALQLSQAHRLSGMSPQSPLKGGAFLQVSGRPTPPPTATSPSPFFALCSPLIQSPRQRVEKLTHCLASSRPAEIVYPSLDQVTAEAEHVSTFLDLYRVRGFDDAQLVKVKSPTTCDGEPWAPFTAPDMPAQPRRRRNTLRRSRSLGDMQSGIAITSDVVHGPAAGRVATAEKTHAMRLGPMRKDSEFFLQPVRRRGAIVKSDARRMAEFRRRFGTRPARLAPRFPAPDAPLPSPPPPSALLEVKSPLPPSLIAPKAVVVVPQPSAYASLVTVKGQSPLRSPQAPYWVKSPVKEGEGIPKTPRTIRSERRQGWGGAWTMGSIGQVVHKLREVQ